MTALFLFCFISFLSFFFLPPFCFFSLFFSFPHSFLSFSISLFFCLYAKTMAPGPALSETVTLLKWQMTFHFLHFSLSAREHCDIITAQASLCTETAGQNLLALVMLSDERRCSSLINRSACYLAGLSYILRNNYRSLFFRSRSQTLWSQDPFMLF